MMTHQQVLRFVHGILLSECSMNARHKNSIKTTGFLLESNKQKTFVL